MHLLFALLYVIFLTLFFFVLFYRKLVDNRMASRKKTWKSHFCGWTMTCSLTINFLLDTILHVPILYCAKGGQ